ncbi:MAG: SprB repeat-containing protein, partial [Bacteroidales bacterium]|nr:SprB repeat-containing protein [Bacteroidales bacterium]
SETSFQVDAGEYDGIKINSLLPNQVFCETDSSGTIEVNSTVSRTTLHEYVLYNSADTVYTRQTSPNFTNLPTDSYKVVAVDNENCESDKTTSINIRADRIQITLDPSDIKPNPCPGKSLAEAKATASLGDESTNNYDFELWKDGSLIQSHNGGTSHTFTGLESEEYTYRVKDDRNCTAETEFTPTANSTPVTLNVLEVKDQLCDEDSSGVIQLSASSSEGAIDSIVDGVGNVYKTGAVTIPKLTAGTYYFDAYDVVGCGDNAEVVINNLNNIPQFTSVTFDSAACDNASNVNLEVGLSQPVLSYGDFDIQLHQAGNLIDQQSARSTKFEGLTNKTYSLEVIDSVGCSHDTTITIPRIKTPVNFSMQIDSTSCDLVANGKVALQALGGTSNVQYKFKLEMNGEADSVMNQVAEFTELPAGESFRISLYDQYGCSEVSPVQYMHSKKQTLNIALNSFVNPTCPDSSNGSINMTALYGQGNNGEFTYYLKDYDTDTELAQQPGTRSYNFKDVPRGRFALGVQDSVGCYAQTELPTTLEEPLPIQVDMAANYIRKKGENTGWVQAQMREGNGKYNYEWYRDNSLLSKSSTTTTVREENLISGTYKLRVQDSAGCTFNGVQWLESSIVIPEPEFDLAVEMLENKRVECHGEKNGQFTLKPVGGWGPDYQYGLGDTSNMQSSPVFENLAPDTFKIFIKDTAGVVSSADFIMTQPEAPLIASLLDLKDARCSNENSGEVLLNVSGGNGKYSVYTTEGDTVAGTSHNNVPAGNQTVYAMDSLGCTASVDVLINKPEPVIIIDSTIIKSKCDTNNGSIEVKVKGGTPGYQYTWHDSLNYISNDGTKLDSLYSGVYSLTVIDSNKCNFNFDFYVSDISDLKIHSLETQAVNCYGGNDGKAIASVTSSNDYTVVWPDDSEGPMASNLSGGSHTLRVYDSEGCKLFKSFTIDSPDSIYYQLNSLVNPTCFGVQDGEIHLEATGGTSGYSYQWNSGKNMRNLNNVDTGNYVVTITDKNQCQRSFAFDLDYSLTLTTNLEDEMTICHNNIYPISIGSYRFYEWSRNGEYLTQDSICYADEAGEYVVDVEDEQGCLATDSITIHMSEAVQTAQFLMATEVYQGDTVVIFEVSDPMPDSINIIYPEGIEQVDSGQYYRHIYVPDTGTFEIELISYMLDCQDITTKKLYVMPRDEDLAWMKSSRRKIIKSFNLTPNPNHGDFDIEVELFEKHDATVRLLSFGEGIVYDSRKMQNAMHYTSHYHLNNVKPGVYLLNLTAGEEMKNIKFIIY